MSEESKDNACDLCNRTEVERNLHNYEDRLLNKVAAASLDLLLALKKEKALTLDTTAFMRQLRQALDEFYQVEVSVGPAARGLVALEQDLSRGE